MQSIDSAYKTGAVDVRVRRPSHPVSAILSSLRFLLRPLSCICAILGAGALAAGADPQASATHGVDGNADTFLPRQIWVESEGCIVLEAENLDHHEHWSLLTHPAGFTGSGYLEWNGPRAPGRGNDDYTGARQHPRNTHLILRVLVSNPGVYRLDVRNIHEREDGDNDAWIGELGRTPESDWPIKRIGDSHKDGKGFTWADWGNRLFPLKRGLNTLYLGGRSPGFGIDRIALWSVDMDGAEEKAHDLATAQSDWTTDPHAGPALLQSPFTLLHATEFEAASDNLETYGSDRSMMGLASGSKAGDVGRLTMAFPGRDGEYTVRLLHLSEASASAHYTVKVGGKTALEFSGRQPSSPEFVSERSGILSLKKNDPVVVEIRSNGNARGRFRALSIHALNEQSSPAAAQSDAPALHAFSATSTAQDGGPEVNSDRGPKWHDPEAPVFVEQNGLVKIEAESLANRADGFTLVTTPEYLAGRSHGFGVDFVTIHSPEYEDRLEEIVHAPESHKK